MGMLLRRREIKAKSQPEIAEKVGKTPAEKTVNRTKSKK